VFLTRTAVGACRHSKTWTPSSTRFARLTPALVVIDPLMAYLPDHVNSHRDQHIRRAMAPVAALAERLGIALVVLRHLNKTGMGNPLYRGGGSIGLIGAARSGLLVASDPDDHSRARRILASTKSNLSALPPALAYRLEEAPNEAVRVEWEGESQHTAKSLLAASTETDEQRDALAEATSFLRETAG
jgi:hypothetical protein